MDAPPSTIAAAIASAIVTLSLLQGPVVVVVAITAISGNWSPTVAYSPNVVIARSRSRKTTSVFHLSSNLLTVPPIG